MEHHATIPPSSIPALLRCGCFKSKPTEEGGAADKGTQKHEQFAAVLRKLGGEASEEIFWAADTVISLCGHDCVIEDKIAVLDKDFNEITFGTADAYSANGQVLVDYKSGQERDYKGQMAAYALGLMDKFGLDLIHCHILYGATQKVVSYDISIDEARAVLAMAQRNVVEGVPTPCDYCKWCEKAADCPAVVERVNAVVAGRADWQLAQYHTSDIRTPDQMAKALEIADAVEVWADNARNYAKMMITNGNEIPGWTLKPRAGKRTVSDVLKAYEITGLSPEAFLKACSVSLPKLEVEYQLVNKDMKKVEAKRQLEAKLAPVIEQGEQSLTLSRVK